MRNSVRWWLTARLRTCPSIWHSAETCVSPSRGQPSGGCAGRESSAQQLEVLHEAGDRPVRDRQGRRVPSSLRQRACIGPPVDGERAPGAGRRGRGRRPISSNESTHPHRYLSTFVRHKSDCHCSPSAPPAPSKKLIDVVMPRRPARTAPAFCRMRSSPARSNGQSGQPQLPPCLFPQQLSAPPSPGIGLVATPQQVPARVRTVCGARPAPPRSARPGRFDTSAVMSRGTMFPTTEHDPFAADGHDRQRQAVVAGEEPSGSHPPVICDTWSSDPRRPP